MDMCPLTIWYCEGVRGLPKTHGVDRFWPLFWLLFLSVQKSNKEQIVALITISFICQSAITQRNTKALIQIEGWTKGILLISLFPFCADKKGGCFHDCVFLVFFNTACY